MTDDEKARKLGMKNLVGIPLDVLSEVRTRGQLLAEAARNLKVCSERGEPMNHFALVRLGGCLRDWDAACEALGTALKVGPIHRTDGTIRKHGTEIAAAVRSNPK